MVYGTGGVWGCWAGTSDFPQAHRRRKCTIGSTLLTVVFARARRRAQCTSHHAPIKPITKTIIGRTGDRDEGCRLFSLSSVGSVFLGCPSRVSPACYPRPRLFLRLCCGVSLATLTSLITLVSRRGADGDGTRARLDQQQEPPPAGPSEAPRSSGCPGSGAY